MLKSGAKSKDGIINRDYKTGAGRARWSCSGGGVFELRASSAETRQNGTLIKHSRHPRLSNGSWTSRLFGPGAINPLTCCLGRPEVDNRECVLEMSVSTRGSTVPRGGSVSLPVPQHCPEATRHPRSCSQCSSVKALMNNSAEELAGFSNLSNWH